jgi:hypothetical protein
MRGAHRRAIRGMVALALCLALSACVAPGAPQLPPAAVGGSTITGARTVITPTATSFDLSAGAALPYHRIVAAYGIVNGGEPNGPASTIGMLTDFLPQLQQLGNQYAALDPTHPVQLGIDLVVNVIQPCGAFPKWCASWADDQTMQAYVDFSQQHNLLLFFDLQLGTQPVSDAVISELTPYLTKYPFTHLALDTEFHFPNTPEGYADAAGYPCCLGWMEASEINWAISALAEMAHTHHLPRKILVIHQWDPSVIRNHDQIVTNPDVSVVVQSDGWGGTENKLGDYRIFVQRGLLEYGGYKLFFPHAGDTQFDVPLQSPEDVMNLFPQPLFISYQ